MMIKNQIFKFVKTARRRSFSWDRKIVHAALSGNPNPFECGGQKKQDFVGAITLTQKALPRRRTTASRISLGAPHFRQLQVVPSHPEMNREGLDVISIRAVPRKRG
jgi:hypothetical protein